VLKEKEVPSETRCCAKKKRKKKNQQNNRKTTTPTQKKEKKKKTTKTTTKTEQSQVVSLVCHREGSLSTPKDHSWIARARGGKGKP